MRRNEFTPPELETQLPLNPEFLGGKARACTGSIFCAGASAEAKHHIAHRAGVSFTQVETQALPQQKPDGVALLNIGNYNNKGTGTAYRQLIAVGVLEIKDGHADTVRPL